MLSEERRQRKSEWQRQQRAAFRAEHGYSTTCHYGAGGKRKEVLERDGYCCVRCGMTDAEHKAKWDRPITIDHKSKDRSDNSLDNLQTLCLTCHGNKDLIPRLRHTKTLDHKATILAMRATGATFREISAATGVCQASICTWLKTWETNK